MLELQGAVTGLDRREGMVMNSQTDGFAAHVIAQHKPCIFQVIVSAFEVLSFLPSRTVTQREFGKFLIVHRNFCPIRYLTGLSP